MRNESGLIEESRKAPRAARPVHRPEDRTGANRRAGTVSLWDIAEVRAYLQVPVSSVYKMTARRARVRIPHIRISAQMMTGTSPTVARMCWMTSGVVRLARSAATRTLESRTNPRTADAMVHGGT